jgi:hypothetical protein
MIRWRSGLLAVALGLTAATPAMGQNARTLIGVSAGAAASELEGGIVNTGARWGFMGGVFGLFRTSRNSVVGLELNYAQKGGKDLARLDYLDIPLTVGVVLPTGNDAVNFNFYTGIGFGFKLGCTGDDPALPEDGPARCTGARSTEWTWPLGLAVALRTAGGKYFGLDGRYSIGISDAFEGSAARNRAWQLRALFAVPVR